MRCGLYKPLPDHQGRSTSYIIIQMYVLYVHFLSMTIDPLQVYVPLTVLVNLSITPHLWALQLDTICGDKQALADLDSVLNTVQPLHKIVKMRITLHMSDHTPLSPIDTLNAGCTMLDPMMKKLLCRGKPMSFKLHPDDPHNYCCPDKKGLLQRSVIWINLNSPKCVEKTAGHY